MGNPSGRFVNPSPVPAQWQYSFDDTGTATATYIGNVKIEGNLEYSGNLSFDNLAVSGNLTVGESTTTGNLSATGTVALGNGSEPITLHGSSVGLQDNAGASITIEDGNITETGNVVTVTGNTSVTVQSGNSTITVSPGGNISIAGNLSVSGLGAGVQVFPSMEGALSIVQSATNNADNTVYPYEASGSNVTVVLDAAPTEGNILICQGWFLSGNGAPVANTGWTLVEQSGTGDGYGVCLLYKIAGSGESETQSPYINPDGGGYYGWGCSITEIANGASWSDIYINYHFGPFNSGNPDFTTAHDDELVLIYASTSNSEPSQVSLSTGTQISSTIGAHEDLQPSYDSSCLVSYTEASSGTTINPTVEQTEGGNYTWVAVELQSGASGTSGYAIFGNILYMQWGQIPSTAPGSGADLTFPIEFPNQCFNFSPTTFGTDSSEDNAIFQEEQGTLTKSGVTAFLKNLSTDPTPPDQAGSYTAWGM